MPRTTRRTTVRTLVRRPVRRSGRRSIQLAVAALLFSAGALLPVTGEAQQPAPASRWEFSISSGRFIPTGDQRSLFMAGDQSTGTLTRRFTPSFAMTSSLGWSRSRAVAGDVRADLLTYDVGAEWRASSHAITTRLAERPLVSAGLGARTLHLRGTTGTTTIDPVAFVGVGGELTYRRLRMRLEVRDYVSGSDAGASAASIRARNDLHVLVGLGRVKR